MSESETSRIFTLINLGEVYFKKKDYGKAEKVLKEGLRLNQLLKKTEYDKQGYELLHKMYKETGRYKEALAIYEKLISINDETLKLQAKDELKQQELKYGYEKKVLNLELVNERKNTTKNTQLIVLGSLLFLLLTGGYFYYKNSKQKQKLSRYEKKELKQKLLLTQMNPHFIFNSIDNIQSLIYNKQEDEAVSYLTKFSKLTRQILENSNENYITLEEELEMMDNYLNIQQLLYNNKFEFTITVDETLELENMLVPPMITQPFIENAVKHGLKNILQKGQIAISYTLETDKLFFTIQDNGEGFQEIEKDSTKKSMAMKITKERLKSISNKSDFEVHLNNILDDNKKVIGAKVFFEIPYIYEK